MKIAAIWIGTSIAVGIGLYVTKDTLCLCGLLFALCATSVIEEK